MLFVWGLLVVVFGLFVVVFIGFVSDYCVFDGEVVIDFFDYVGDGEGSYCYSGECFYFYFGEIGGMGCGMDFYLVRF